MSQREQPDRECKRKKQVVVLNRGNSAVSVESSAAVSVVHSPFSGSSSSSVERSSVTSVPPSSLPCGNSTADTIVLGDSARGCNILGDLTDSDTTLVYPTMSEEERDSDHGTAGGSASSCNPEMRSLFREFFSEFSRSGLMSDRPRESSTDADLTRHLNALAPHKDGVDISKYIRKLEADLRDIGCPRRRWKSILLQKLQSKSASSIVAGLDRDTTDYDQVKEILIEALGSSLTSLGVKLTTDFASSTRSMNPLETYVHLKSLMQGRRNRSGCSGFGRTTFCDEQITA